MFLSFLFIEISAYNGSSRNYFEGVLGVFLLTSGDLFSLECDDEICGKELEKGHREIIKISTVTLFFCVEIIIEDGFCTD